MNVAVVPTTLASPIPDQPLTIERPTPLNLLVVDNDRFVREACSEASALVGYLARATESSEQALWLIDSQSIDVVLVDLDLQGAGGLEVLRQIKRRQPDIEVIVMTGNGSVQSAVQAMKAGAYDYVAKPFGLNELKRLLERVAAHLKQKSENRKLCDEMKSNRSFGNIIGRTPEMDRLYRIISKAAHSAQPVLILGESGTGKEMVARAIHYSGRFRDKPFVPVDCGSLVPTLIESELFGHVKGAFTGASHAKDGLLALAEVGTVFLDEIGELPLDLQSKLLRALQE
jgi:DNA-binding NtrC family response regulator